MRKLVQLLYIKGVLRYSDAQLKSIVQLKVVH